MSYLRPSAWPLIVGALVVLLLLSTSSFAYGAQPKPTPEKPMVANPVLVCSPGQLPTGWPDDLTPPNTIRVLRSKGPNAGHVETVNFWDYVAVVMRAEYSTGADKPPLWMQAGTITVKEYGWYKAMFWGGGRTSFTVDNGDGTTTTTTECYDAKDTTADQIYKPKQVGSDGTIYEGNVPTEPIYRAMAQTWQMSMRKWVADKGTSRLFLTGYRSGSKTPCGSDSTGFKIYQQSLYDCTTKHMTLEETLREYFEPMLVVDTREHDSLSSNGWWGDLAVLTASGGNTSWNLYPGKSDGFGNVVHGAFSVPFGSMLGYGTGNVDLPDTNTSAVDKKMLADIVMVTNNSVFVARATGNGFASPLTQTSFSGGANKAVFGDFNGDLMMDVGIVRSNGNGTSSLLVMTSNGDDTFADPRLVWSGTVDLTSASTFVAAGDLNGDGKADLIVRDEGGNFQTALSPATCSNLSATGNCPVDAVGGFVLGSLNLALADPGGLTGAKLVVGDYDRDGRADVLAVVGGSTSSVVGMRGQNDGSFTAKQQLWSSSTMNLSTSVPVAMNVNADGMTDLALVQGSSVQWLRAVEKTKTTAAQMTTAANGDPHIGPDTTPPSVPTGAAGVVSPDRTVSLSWNASTDNASGTITYRVFRDGSPIGSQQVGLTYVDHPETGQHQYQVRAVDAAGNNSDMSAAVNVTVTDPVTTADTTPPSAPTGIAGVTSPGRTVSMSWHASTDNASGTLRYRVFRDGRPIGWKQKALTYIDHPKAGKHDYQVRAIDAAGNMGAKSNTISLIATD